MTDIKYPRNQLIRGGFQLLGRLILKLLTKPKIDGLDKYPQSGGLLVVANHSGLIETVMMTCFAPRQIEYMGSTDIPHEKILAFIMNAYKFIPVYRGNVSVSAMKDGISVLKQGGVIGIFPEGGIWEPEIRKAHSGVAWMSYHSQTPILPIGFTPTDGALKQALAFKRPTIEMRIGNLIPPMTLTKDQPKKEQFQQEAQRIMDAVWELVPPKSRSSYPSLESEKFDFQIEVFSKQNTPIEIPVNLSLKNGASLSKILYRTTLINNLKDNLKLDIAPLKDLDRHPAPEELIHATDQILSYLSNDNPYYFTYRYGQEEGKRMGKSIQELHDLSSWAAQNNLEIKAQPIRTIKLAGEAQEIVETSPTEMDKW